MELDRNHIVCGRGFGNWNHAGNRAFRRVVKSRLAQYMDERTTRTAKTRLVADTLQDLLEMNMVFVTRTNDDGDLVTLSIHQARAKVAHMFRDFARQARIRPAPG
ncbi:hypothetical protein MHU86_6144 [Fragilaria crotonensis]|nr:hypothetical protein MHU86_6144 [Fragilaria crotonensis]